MKEEIKEILQDIMYYITYIASQTIDKNDTINVSMKETMRKLGMLDKAKTSELSESEVQKWNSDIDTKAKQVVTLL